MQADHQTSVLHRRCRPRSSQCSPGIRSREITAVENASVPIDPVQGDFPLGAHLVTPRRGYTHHGIHVGGGRVVHYAGLCSGRHRGPVEEVSLACFAQGCKVSVRPTHARYAAQEVVDRARSRLGEDRYQLSRNNCEHFCEWCISGESRSQQVERILAYPRAATAAANALLQTLFAARWSARARGCSA